MTDTKSEDRMCNLLLFSPMWTVSLKTGFMQKKLWRDEKQGLLLVKPPLNRRWKRRLNHQPFAETGTTACCHETSTTTSQMLPLGQSHLPEQDRMSFREREMRDNYPPVTILESLVWVKSAQLMVEDHPAQVRQMKQLSCDKDVPFSPIWHMIQHSKERIFPGPSKNTKWTKKISPNQNQKRVPSHWSRTMICKKNGRKRRQDLCLSRSPQLPFIMSYSQFLYRESYIFIYFLLQNDSDREGGGREAEKKKRFSFSSLLHNFYTTSQDISNIACLHLCHFSPSLPS